MWLFPSKKGSNVPLRSLNASMPYLNKSRRTRRVRPRRQPWYICALFSGVAESSTSPPLLKTPPQRDRTITSKTYCFKCWETGLAPKPLHSPQNAHANADINRYCKIQSATGRTRRAWTALAQSLPRKVLRVRAMPVPPRPPRPQNRNPR